MPSLVAALQVLTCGAVIIVLYRSYSHIYVFESTTDVSTCRSGMLQYFLNNLFFSSPATSLNPFCL